MLKGKSLAFSDLIWQCFTGHSYNDSHWYMANQIIIIILFVLFKIVKESNWDITLILIVGLCFIIQYSRGTVACAGWFNYELSTVVARLPEILPFAIWGLSMHKFEERINKKSRNYIVAILVCILYVVWTLPFPEPQGFMYQGYKVFLGSVALSTAMIWLPIRNVKCINYLSKYTLGLYCVHMLIGEELSYVLDKNGVFYLRSPVFCLLIYIVSLLVAVGIGHIPILKKIVC